MQVPSFWQSYKQGVGIALGVATVYLILVALLGAFVVRPALENLGKGGQAGGQGGAACSTSWA
ncbi:hypothetical protein [Thermus brockianus]